MEQTLLILKPDTVQRGLIGEVISRIEQRGLRISGMKMMQITSSLAAQHYAEHQGKSFYDPLIAFITSAPVVVMVVSGPQAIAIMRAMMGKTDAREAAPGTIRGDYGLSNRHNLIHGSDSPESAQREIALFFKPGELYDYKRVIEPWIGPEEGSF
ncbi:MAG: nucleoside-diphosphate kinase [Anaerolineae bacterium]|nr:nucleoside-diphosphate kinase [Anaerolineae bacterium]